MEKVEKLHIVCRCPICKEEFALGENRATPMFQGMDNGEYYAIEFCYSCAVVILRFIKSLRRT